jgi:hypothetical protein
MADTLTTSLTGTVAYLDGTLFDGWGVFLEAFPTGYSYATINNQLIPQKIGDRFRVRIKHGVYDGSTRVYQNNSLQPPNTQYVAYFYDNEDQLMGSTGLFTVSVTPFSISVPPMTVNLPIVIPPTPDPVTTSQDSLVTVNGVPVSF